MKENLKTICDKAEANRPKKTETHTMANGSETCETEGESTATKMALGMMVIGSTERKMVLVSKPIKMETSMKAIG